MKEGFIDIEGLIPNAVSAGDINELNCLIENGYVIDSDDCISSPIHNAIDNDDYKMTKALISHHATIMPIAYNSCQSHKIKKLLKTEKERQLDILTMALDPHNNLSKSKDCSIM